MIIDSKVMLVTGAAQRIGAYIAQAAHADGYNIVLHYRSSAKQTQALKDQLNAIRARPLVCGFYLFCPLPSERGLGGSAGRLSQPPSERARLGQTSNRPNYCQSWLCRSLDTTIGKLSTSSTR